MEKKKGLIEVQIEPNKPFTNKELARIKKKHPELNFRMEIKKGKQYIYLLIKDSLGD